MKISNKDQRSSFKIIKIITQDPKSKSSLRIINQDYQSVSSSGSVVSSAGSVSQFSRISCQFSRISHLVQQHQSVSSAGSVSQFHRISQSVQQDQSASLAGSVSSTISTIISIHLNICTFKCPYI